MPDEHEYAGAVIIELPRATDKPLLSCVEDVSFHPCRAHSFEMNDKERTVRCKRCGCKFEAFDAMMALRKTWDRYYNQIVCYKREIERLEQEREQLKRDVRNLKAQRHRQRGRDAKLEGQSR